MIEELKAARELNLQILGQLDPKELNALADEHLSDEQIRNRAADAEIFYTKHFEGYLKRILLLQLKNMGELAETPGQVLFYRGELALIDLIDTWFKEQFQISRSRFDKPTKKEGDTQIPSIT